MKSGAGSPSRTIGSSSRRAIGVIRISRVGGRDGERFVSPSEQRERIASACERDGLQLIDTLEEPNVSGGTPLVRRRRLREAVERIEAGEADVLVVAFFDRLVRSLAVQREVVERVELAGGRIVAVDVGEVRADTASRWLSSTMLGMVAEYHRRVTSERTAEAKRRAVERGVPPFPRVPPGYRRTGDGRLEPDPKEARVVAEAFELRARGASVREVRDFLAERGIQRSFHGTQALLTSRIVLGELRFGEIVNEDAHEPIVPADVWHRVQRMRSSRGRPAKSERLLARLGVLRCGTCGARMVVGTANHSGYYLYRCPPVGDCGRRVTVSAELVENVVIETVRDLLGGLRGTAALADGLADAERELELREQELDAVVRTFSGLADDVAAARERLAELRTARDAAQDRVAELRVAAAPAVSISVHDWDQLTLEERRALVRAAIDHVDVAPGRGRDRVAVHPRFE